DALDRVAAAQAAARPVADHRARLARAETDAIAWEVAAHGRQDAEKSEHPEHERLLERRERSPPRLPDRDDREPVIGARSQRVIERCELRAEAVTAGEPAHRRIVLREPRPARDEVAQEGCISPVAIA